MYRAVGMMVGCALTAALPALGAPESGTVLWKGEPAAFASHEAAGTAGPAEIPDPGRGDASGSGEARTMGAQATVLRDLPSPAAAAQGAARTPPADESTPAYLWHRGPGIRTSMFGTYVRPGELFVYTFFEYYRDHNLQYTPAEFGHGLDQDFLGRYRASEGLVFLAYGISDRFALEVEAAVIRASLSKDPSDPTSMPAKVEEEGMGDIEGQLTCRWAKESARRPEFFSYLEVAIPHHRDEPLRGTSDWEAKLGTGATRGLPWGNLQARIALEYARASETPWDLGEWAVEYLRRLSPSWRIYAGFEGQALDELALITEVQRSLGSHATLKVGNGFGLTANTTDLAPEVGVILSLPAGTHRP